MTRAAAGTDQKPSGAPHAARGSEPDAKTAWDPAAYTEFVDERLRPARDLIERIPPIAARRIYDLGCGAGLAARMLAKRWPDAAVAGIDASAEMLAMARATPAEVQWIQSDIAAWAPAEPPDLIFSNAALHWLNNHSLLIPRLLETLSPGGVLAVQMPRNYAAPSHRALGEVANGKRWRERLATVLRPWPVADPEVYLAMLIERAARVDVWETTYLHVLSGENPVLAWVSGTALRPLLAILDDSERADFLAAYAGRLAQAYPRRADGRTVFPFRRLFIVAAR